MQILINDRLNGYSSPPAPTLIYSNLLSETAKKDEVKRRRSTLTPQEMSLLKKKPRKLVCCNCRQKVVSEARTHYSMETCFWFSFFFCCGGIFCSWVPFVLNEMKQTIHFCPKCHSILGAYKPKCRNQTKVLLAVITLFCFSVVTVGALCWGGVIALPFLR